jgi:hypothetical protein
MSSIYDPDQIDRVAGMIVGFSEEERLTWARAMESSLAHMAPAARSDAAPQEIKIWALNYILTVLRRAAEIEAEGVGRA